MRKNILIVDGLNFLIPLVYSTKYYLNSNLIDIYPTYKFLMGINLLKFIHDIDEIIVIFEIGRDIRKKRISDTYKSNRIQSRESIKIRSDERIYNTITENRKILINIFSESKIKQYVSLFIEGDTIVYGIVKMLSEDIDNNYNIYVLSNDTDLYQIFNNLFKVKNISLIKRNLFRKNREENNDNDNTYYELLKPFQNIEDKKKIIKQVFKIDNEKEFQLIIKSIENYLNDLNIKNFITLFKTLCGDKSDNIINVKNFGIKSFIKIFPFLCEITNSFNIDLINNIDYILDELKKFLLKESNRNFVKISGNLFSDINLIKINLKLVDLDYSFNSIDIKTYTEIRGLCFSDKKVDDTKVLKYINEYEINSIEEWSNIILNNVLLNKKIRNAVDKNVDKDINCIQKIIYVK